MSSIEIMKKSILAPTTFTDKISGQHTYFVRAFDAFSEIPDKVYYLEGSDPVTSKYIPPVDTDTSGIIQLTNSCPVNYNEDAELVITDVNEIIAISRLMTDVEYLDVFVNGKSVGYLDVYELVGANAGENAVYDQGSLYLSLNASDTVELTTNDRKQNKGDLNVRLVGNSTPIDYDGIVVFPIYNNTVHEDIGGSCVIGQMKYTPSTVYKTCPGPKNITYKGIDDLNAFQPMNLTSSLDCKFDTLTINQSNLLGPNYVTLYNQKTSYTGNGTYNFSADRGVSITAPSDTTQGIKATSKSSQVSLKPIPRPVGMKGR